MYIFPPVLLFVQGGFSEAGVNWSEQNRDLLATSRKDKASETQRAVNFRLHQAWREEGLF